VALLDGSLIDPTKAMIPPAFLRCFDAFIELFPRVPLGMVDLKVDPGRQGGICVPDPFPPQRPQVHLQPLGGSQKSRPAYAIE
jgi:hypothetical protein